MKIDYLTLFPEMFDGVLNHSIMKRAQENNKLQINTVNFRDYAINKHNQVLMLEIMQLTTTTRSMIIRMVADKVWC